MNDFYKIANEILQIPEENLSWEERLNELVKFRAYLISLIFRKNRKRK